MSSGNSHVSKLDFPTSSPQAPLLGRRQGSSHSSIHTDNSAHDGYHGRFFERVAENIQEKDRRRIKREVLRYVSFVWAIVSCLCAGSITGFSLYGHLFQSRLHYSQGKVNIVSIVGEIATYLPVPLFGLLVDRRGPAPASLLAGLFFGFGYILAAHVYKSNGDIPFHYMVLSFVGIGMGTSAMYLGAVTTCAKNFGRGNHKGFALAMPIAAFGLSGMWQSQVGATLLYESGPDGTKGDVDVFRYFLFLGGLLMTVGLLGTFLLRIVDEEDMIDEAVEQLEHSGLLEDSGFFRAQNGGPSRRNRDANYGTMASDADADDGASSDEENGIINERPSTSERLAGKQQKREDALKKSWLLNAETHRYLSDPTMWLLTAGFFLVSGPGEAFINNLGTLIGTLYPPPTTSPVPSTTLNSPPAPTPAPTSPATHVSIVAVASTIARLVSGTLSDLLSPRPRQSPPPPTRRTNTHTHTHTRHSSTLSHTTTTTTSSLSSLASNEDPLTSYPTTPHPTRLTRLKIPRPALLLTSTFLLSLAFLLLASGAVQSHGSTRFWLVSVLVGLGYGATFSLVPIIISCVWGVDNFATNWGITAMAPAGGAALWGALYAVGYERAVGSGGGGGGGGGEEGLCFGVECYRGTSWGMFAAVWVAGGLWVWAWRGPGGWRRRGVVV
ncbi:MAG: putative monocarboxylate transporter mch1 [Chrysothrix sp. TS-e1954]|nr:MAG: putative monocarboxylate transporter mch1 [Chrysothrix sp. TS-e1954]